MKRILLLLFIILLSNSGFAQECLRVSEGLSIDDNAVLCRDTYFITSSIEVIKDNITIDCNNAAIIGNKENAGIKMESREGLIIKNCNISNFETGISIEDSRGIELINNIISNNINGIFIINSRDYSLTDNVYLNNIKDVLNVSFIEEEEELDPEPQQKTETEIIVELEENTTAVFNEIKELFSQYINQSEEIITINRTFFYNETENSTTVKITITPKATAINYSYYEKIPKCMAMYAKEVIFRETNFKVIVDDPLIMWSFAELPSERERSYKVYKQLSEDCKSLLEGFGIATGFEEAEARDYSTIILTIIISVLIVLGVITIKRMRR